jgi:Peptidase family S41/PDZ domain
VDRLSSNHLFEREKIMKRLVAVALCFFSVGPLSAQLSRDQKFHDFENLAALYAKRYAPYEWKRAAVGFDLFDIGPWLNRVSRSKDDLEFMEICAEYVAGLDDIHSRFVVPSTFVANAGFTVDIYDGKVVIDSINRLLLPANRFPFQVGDELVSVDRKSVEDLIQEFSRLRRRGNPTTTRRASADLITIRRQQEIPRAVELGEAASMVIRRQNGDLETYSVPWMKTGYPLINIGPVPKPGGLTASDFSAPSPSEQTPDYLRPLLELQNFRAPEDDHLLSGWTYSEETDEILPRRYVLGYGSRTPAFALPQNFVQRLGRTPADFHFSGTYEADGLRIGYLRIPNFGPPITAIREVATEVAYFEENTDGLVVDVMRNPGGGCYMLDVASYLIPYPFYFFGEEIRVTLDRINGIYGALESARRLQAPQQIIDAYTAILNALESAYKRNRGRTGAVPACTAFGSPFPPSLTNQPAKDASGKVLAYTKPLIVLVDEFSTSAGDIFPAMLQDNKRGPLVGARTNGGGGAVSTWPAGFYSESLATNTNTLVVRLEPIYTPDLPAAPYIENIGARPDVRLEFMTRENLLTRGRPFVEGFTRILVNHIRTTQ